MTFDKQAEYRKQLEHLVSMAQKPEWKAHAWAQAKELDAGDSGLFKGIAKDLTDAVRQKIGQGKPLASEPMNPVKPL